MVGITDTTAESAILDESGQPILIRPAALIGADVGSASAGSDPETGRQHFVSVAFQDTGSRKWELRTGAAACNAPATP